MGDVEQGTIIKVVATSNLPGAVKIQNVFYWKMGGTDPRPDTTVLAAVKTWLDAWYAELEPQLNEGFTAEDFIVHEWDYDEIEGWQTGRFVGTDILTAVGTAVVGMFPHAVAAVITAFTEDVRRRSRKSIGGVDEGWGEDSIWSASVLTGLAAMGASWLTDIVVAGADFLSSGLPGNDGVWYKLLSILVSSIAGSQRQRKPGIGI